MATILMPLPDTDFEPAEAAVPWKLLREAGHQVVIATERGGRPPAADPVQLRGIFFGRFGSDAEPKAFYGELERSPEFRAPVPWAQVRPEEVDGLVLPGGHAPGMRPYLESEAVQRLAARLLAAGKPVGAICHGVLVPARARDPESGRSAIAAKRTTCLPKYLERVAYLATAWRYGRRFRTYPRYVEDEVRAALDDPERQLERGPRVLLRRGSAEDDSPAFCVVDGNYVSARWLGDAYLFGKRFLELVERGQATSEPSGSRSSRG